MSTARITLYTNYVCPWAHRAHIALNELGLPFEEVIIDIDKLREPWYLDINPRGLVPCLRYNDEIITESAIVARFLADAHPSHLVPPSTNDDGPLLRARIAFFAETLVNKTHPHFLSSARATCDKDRLAATEDLVAAIQQEVEPLIYPSRATAREAQGDFFQGSDKLTLAEVLTGSFVVRYLSFAQHGLVAPTLQKLLGERAPNFLRWAKAVSEHPSVLKTFNDKDAAERLRSKFVSK